MIRPMPKSINRLSLAALSVELTAAAVPTDIRLIPAGEFRSHDGRPAECAAYVMTAEDGARIAAATAAAQRSRVIDYEHATLHAKTSGIKAPAAGWFKDLEWRADGLWATGVDWTALAVQEIADKAYRYISPVFSYDKTSGRVQNLFHAALTNDPGLDGLGDLAALAALLLPQPNNPQETSVNETLKKLLAALGLQDTATEAEALSALDALKTNVATLTAQVATSQLPDPARFVPVATLTAMQGEYATLQGRLTALSAEVNTGKLDKVIAEGLAAGKLTPATEGWARELGQANLTSLTTYLAAAPVVLAPGATQTNGKGPESGTAALSAIEQEVCDKMAIQLDAYRKTNAAKAA